MTHLKKVFILCGFLLLYVSTNALPPPEQVQKYIAQYASIAVSEMQKSGIPASIKLAQAMLESKCGSSDLSTRANNHFGIKCKWYWQGKSVKHTDDAPDECFRAYESVSASFRDHSEFLLMNKSRYGFLFAYDITDYKSWAIGLKKAGYATAKDYPQRLIEYIETYKLYQYDNPNYPKQ